MKSSRTAAEEVEEAAEAGAAMEAASGADLAGVGEEMKADTAVEV